MKGRDKGQRQEQAQSGFTLVEVLMVVVILAMLSAIAIPKVSASSETARKNADIATAHQVKAALDRYQAENGIYPKTTDAADDDKGKVNSTVLIPKYISKLDADTTQQQAVDAKKGFGVATLKSDGTIDSESTPTNLVMIYLSSDGSGAEVRAYDVSLSNIIWTSAN